MSSVQVKNVDEETHELLRQRAAAAGMTLGEYVLELIRKDLRKPSRTEWLARLRALPPAGISHDETLRQLDAQRAERAAQIDAIVAERER
jgi:plasmid stability protein